MRASRHRSALVFLVAFAFTGCSAPGVNVPPATQVRDARAPRAKLPAPVTEVPQSKGKQDLERGIENYEEGAYKAAAKQFQAALDLGLAARSDQATAHKYLAFVACVSGREASCRDEFRKALEADPQLDLEPAEAGHPIWGPVFRTVKAELAGKAKRK